MADLETKCEWKVDLEMAKAQGEEYYKSFLECYSEKMKEDKCPECIGKDQSRGCYSKKKN